MINFVLHYSKGDAERKINHNQVSFFATLFSTSSTKYFFDQVKEYCLKQILT